MILYQKRCACSLKMLQDSHYHFVSDGKVLIKRYSGTLEALNSNIIPASLQTEHTTNKCIDSKAIEVNDCVKIINKPYKGFYAIVTSKSYGNELEIQYLKKAFDKYVLKEDIDSREPEDLLRVEPTVNSRGRYAFSE